METVHQPTHLLPLKYIIKGQIKIQFTEFCETKQKKKGVNYFPGKLLVCRTSPMFAIFKKANNFHFNSDIYYYHQRPLPSSRPPPSSPPPRHYYHNHLNPRAISALISVITPPPPSQPAPPASSMPLPPSCPSPPSSPESINKIDL